MTLLVQHSAHRGSSYQLNGATGHIIYMICPYSIVRLSQCGRKGIFYLPMVIYHPPLRRPEKGEGEDSSQWPVQKVKHNLAIRTVLSLKRIRVQVTIYVPASFQCKYKRSEGTGTL
jgi:hypothetical protein